jgi:hypothetical protein
MMQRVATVLAAVAIVTSSNAFATFHLWVIDQIYSDASGNVQYVQFATVFATQEFLTQTSLQASRGGATNSFPFPSDLPQTAGSTTNKKFIVATQGFVNLAILTPDYVVPNKFLFIPNGTVTLLGADSVTYVALPTTGTDALNRTGNVVAATPTNFAGQSTMINVPPPTPAGPYDVDGNGQVDALTDGLLLIRYMFGLRGPSLVAGAIGQSAARNTAAAVEAHIASQIPPP